MKKIILIATFILGCVTLHSQDKKVYEGNSTSSFDVINTIKDDKVYNGNSTSYFDIAYTIKDGKVYKGNSTSSFDIVNTIE